jgi:hypothetical protein
MQLYLVRGNSCSWIMHVALALTNRLFEIQEAACNHVLTIGYGAFHGMNDERLITVTTRMHIEVDRYPAW